MRKPNCRSVPRSESARPAGISRSQSTRPCVRGVHPRQQGCLSGQAARPGSRVPRRGQEFLLFFVLLLFVGQRLDSFIQIVDVLPLLGQFRAQDGHTGVGLLDGVVIHEEGDEAGETAQEGEEDGGGGHQAGTAAAVVAAQQLVDRLSPGRLAVGAQGRPAGAGQQDEKERGQGQQRRQDEEESGGLVQGVEHVRHDQPFSSSALSTSTLRWLL